MNDKIPFVESVKCESCGKIHEVDSYDYFTIHGNLTRGLDFGIGIDNNLDEQYNLRKASIYCRDCLRELLFPVKNRNLKN